MRPNNPNTPPGEPLPSAADRVTPSNRGRGWAALGLLGVGFFLFLGLVGWYTGPRVPEPPDPDLRAFDVAAAASLTAARTEVRSRPRSGEAWGRFGALLMVHNFQPEAGVCFVQAARFDPVNPRWPYLAGIIQSQRDPDRALESLKTAAGLAGAEPLAVRLRYADQLLRLERFSEAEEQFRRSLDVRVNPWAALGLGRALVRQDRLAEAAEALTAAAKNSSTRDHALALLAQVYERQGDHAGARHTVDQVSSEGSGALPDPFVEEVYGLQVGLVPECARVNQLISAGRAQDAVTLAAKTVETYPQAELAWLTLGMAHLECRNWPGAVGVLKTAVRLAPGSVEIRLNLGNALYMNDEIEAAAGHLREATRLNPRCADAWTSLAICSERLGRRDEAIEFLRRAIEVEPYNAELHRKLSVQLERAGRLAEAADEERRKRSLLADQEGRGAK